MADYLSNLYPWIKSIHIMAVMSWMAGLFYLPRVMVYHVERTTTGDILDQTFQVMEFKLLKVIMNPAMIVTWVLESFWQSRLGSWIGQKHGPGLKRFLSSL